MKHDIVKPIQRQSRSLNVWHLVSTVVALATLASTACDSTPPGSGQGGTAGAAGLGGGGQGGAAGSKPQLVQLDPTHYRIVGLLSAPVSGGAGGAGGSASGGVGGTATGGTGGGSGSSGSGPQLTCTPVVPSGTPPAIAVCGDGFRVGAEQCDDGNLLSGDGCDATCQVTPMLLGPHVASSAVPLPARELGRSRHPVSAGCNTTGAAFLDRSSQPAALTLATFSSVGKPQKVIPFGTADIDSPDPALAALPDDTYVAAWTDFDGDGDEVGIRLGKINPLLTTQAPPIFANAARAFSQHDPDIVFDGQKLVVAWVDDSNPATGPDIRYRTFAPDLTPLADDQTLAATTGVENQVALAAFNGVWAAAWRSGNAGTETIEAQSGTAHWSIAPFAPGASDDRPALAFLDATHLAVAFTEGTDPASSGTASTPRLHAAILDAASPGLTPSFAIAPSVAPYSVTPTLSQTQPALTVFADRVLVGWRSAAMPGDALGEELWARELKWTRDTSTSILVDVSSPELPLLGPNQRSGDQSTPVLVSSSLWPEHRLLSAWQDSGRTFGPTSGLPDVGLQFAQAPTTDAATVRFPLSSDGKYYNVNVLRRGPVFSGPTAAATFIAPGVQYIFPPSSIFDGDDNCVCYTAGTTTPLGPSTTAGEVVTIDLGRVVSLAAARQLYLGIYTSPNSYQLRLAETAGQWTMVVPSQTIDHTSTALDVSLLNEFAPTRARYVELTLVGVPTGGVVNLSELFLYPSAPMDPPPSTADGYDLTYLPDVTATVNANILATYPPAKLYDKDFYTWLTGKTVAQGATGDGTFTLDLGGWYGISQVAMMFDHQANWPTGGRIEISPDQATWTKVYDSNVGTVFGSIAVGPQLFTFPKQTSRYVRITDYFVSGQGVGNGAFTEMQVF